MMFINCGRARKDHLCTHILLFTSVLTGGICQLYCPELVELESSAQLTCVYPNDWSVSYRPKGDPPVASCDPDGICNVFGDDRFNATNINKTHSRLMITNVQVSDGGEWICEESFYGVRNECIMYPFKTPTCHITSGNDTNNLDIHDNISLSVNVTDYYCSTPIDFLLQAGNAEEGLLKNHRVETITSDLFESTFNITEKHIGSVVMIFICNNVRKTVECGGVQTLQRRPPVCSITANRDAGKLNVGDEMTMTVYIEDYSCYRSLEFFLQTGGETDRLKVTGICNEPITFTVKESHFGPVYLEMNCNDVSRNLTCDGVHQLNKTHVLFSGQHTSTVYHLHGIECDTRSCLLLLGVGTGVAGTLLLVGLCHLAVYLISKKNTVCLSGNHYDGLLGRNVDARTGYDDVGIPRSQEADAAEGGEYEMTGNHYENPQRGNDDDTANYVEMDKPATEGI